MENDAGHQYLDGPRDDVQVIASIGEYGDDWCGWFVRYAIDDLRDLPGFRDGALHER
jgi:hypothetical protein